MSERRHRHAPPAGTLLCSVAEVPDGGGREIVFGEGRDAFRVLLLRRGDDVWAYRNLCPHFSLPLHYHPQRFVTMDGALVVCAHHNSVFRFEDGACVDGPCGQVGLEPFSIRRDGDRVVAGGSEP